MCGKGNILLVVELQKVELFLNGMKRVVGLYGVWVVLEKVGGLMQRNSGSLDSGGVEEQTIGSATCRNKISAILKEGGYQARKVDGFGE